MTAYDPQVNLLRATTEAMAAIIGGCDALIVGPFTEARGAADELAERLALNTQLLLRDEAYFDRVADPAAGSFYIEALTDSLVKGEEVGAQKPVFIGVNRYPDPGAQSPETVTPGRAMSGLESCRRRAARAVRRPTVRLVRGVDEKMSRARAAFSREFFVAGGFEVIDADADLTVLCDADANYPATREFPVLAAGLDFNRTSDHAALIGDWLDRLGVL
jgi:methylmalonyl-CoA mutase N-terminal domain/subunit